MGGNVFSRIRSIFPIWRPKAIHSGRGDIEWNSNNTTPVVNEKSQSRSPDSRSKSSSLRNILGRLARKARSISSRPSDDVPQVDLIPHSDVAHHHQHSASLNHSQDRSPEDSKFSEVNPDFKWMSGRRYHGGNDVQYILPVDVAETDRLHLQHYVFKDVRQCNFWAPVRDVLNKDAKVLDIGTGSGIWCLEMATEFPTAEIYGIDLSDRFPTTIKPRNCTFISGNILDGLPFDDAHFDFVFQRMLCAALTKAQWHQVCKEIYRVLKPGGYVEFFDFDGLARGGPKSEELSKMFLGTGLLRDVDMTMGAKVADTLQKGGFIVETKTYVSIPYGNSKVHGSVGRYMAENGRLAYTALETPVLRTSNWSSERYNQLLQDVYQEWENGQIYSNFYCAIGRRPE